MAVLDEVRGIFVSIQAAGKDLEELDAQHHPGQGKSCPTLTTYVEAVDNAEFAIRLTVDHNYAWGLPHHGLAFFIKFREVNIDQVEEETDASATDELGMVQVKVCRVKVGQPLGEPPLYGAGEPDSFELSEKSLKGKAVSHVTSYSEARGFRLPSTRHLERHPGDTSPIAIFQFRYLSREALKQESVVPRTPDLPSTVGGVPNAESDRLDGLFASTQATIETIAGLHIKCESGESPDFTRED
ncbi:hypothetical protein DL767_005273 [Monosporascus sp. MG133]|nr:hypothetical protein DL767_005273 [Monosporascus sp. MG133]